MTREEKLKMLEEWQAVHDNLEAQFDALGKMFDGVTGPLFDSAWNAFTNYTTLIAVLLGDELGAVEWFWYECDFGRKPLEGGNAEEMREIATFQDLLWLIEVCE